ncbi:hypothetical protein U1Q18_052812 [Sarracenia purpurea var. burkii]
MESNATEKRSKKREEDSTNPRLSKKRKKVYTSFGPPPQILGVPSPPIPQTEVIQFNSSQSRHLYIPLSSIKALYLVETSTLNSLILLICLSNLGSLIWVGTSS